MSEQPLDSLGLNSGSNLQRLTLSAKHGDEQFHASGKELGFGVIDFWRWSVSDLVSNATRGRVAEFIVAKALGVATNTIRDEWAAFDLLIPHKNLKVEVKSAAYFQSWNQKERSSITFKTRRTRAWNPETNALSEKSKRQADIYVFALLAYKEDKLKLDPLDVHHWKFYVLSTAVLDARTTNQDSISLGTLEAELKNLDRVPVDYFHLSDSVIGC